MAAELSVTEEVDAPDITQVVNKWEVLENLAVARKTFRLSDRTLTVLRTLLGFHRRLELSAQDRNRVVFASNAAICTRLNGMPCSTMRRHLGALVNAGFLIRRDSPNGKRYTRRRNGTVQAFGFDLTPLLTHAEEIAQAAQEVLRQQEALNQARENLSLVRRDLIGLLQVAENLNLDPRLAKQALGQIDAIRKLLRRQTSIETVEEMHRSAEELSVNLLATLSSSEGSMSSTDNQNEQHNHTQNLDTHDNKEPDTQAVDHVLKNAEDIYNIRLQSLEDVRREADWARKLLSVSNDVWHNARYSMGHTTASLTVFTMLVRGADIISPDSYLDGLVRRNREGRFDIRRLLQSAMRMNEKQKFTAVNLV